jgi:hypothetical protein
MAMVSISVKSRVKPDGTLDLNIATGLPESDVEVLVVVQPLPLEQHNGWPEGFIGRTFGCLRDDPITREPQSDYEVREDLH